MLVSRRMAQKVARESLHRIAKEQGGKAMFFVRMGHLFYAVVKGEDMQNEDLLSTKTVCAFEDRDGWVLEICTPAQGLIWYPCNM